jgi:hypothetical protein
MVVYGKIKCQGTCKQPTLFSQPASAKVPLKPDRPMSDLARDLHSRVKEIFYSYGNRRTSDNRSAQTTLGPSEIGTPCDRRLAMSLMRCPPVNPGGDGWASFVGTCVHAGLADMFLWASGDTGRFAVETPLAFPSKLVPRGTGDLLDRVLCTFIDHKAQGSWSRNKLKTQGPGETYRVQLHTYAYGARQRGEKVDYVALISWPREASNLDDLYVWAEPYSPTVARDALCRVDDIQERIEAGATPGDFDVADDCRYCPHFLKGSKALEDGCNGRQ